MADLQLNGRELLAWRRQLLVHGGRSVDLDWLLDLAAGVPWSLLQRVHLDPGAVELTLKCPLEELEALWRQHQTEHIPLQHLVGRSPWRDFELLVSDKVLIPRQETELLADLALACVGDGKARSGVWADLGTGSGALAIALARALPRWQGHAVDCCSDALAMARGNVAALAADANCHFHQGSWWEPLRSWWGQLDLVVSNPPYIPSAVVDALDPVVREHEPRLALDGGTDGLDCCRDLLAGARYALAPGGWLLVEHHHDQSGSVMALMAAMGLHDVHAEKDLEGKDRFAIARRSECV